VAIVNKVYPSVFANDTANALDSTNYATGANKVNTFLLIFNMRFAPLRQDVVEWLVYFRNDLSFPLVFPGGHGGLSCKTQTVIRKLIPNTS